MAIGRGIMQVSRINIYPTVASFISISPADFTTCGIPITFSVNVANQKSPFTPTPGPSDGYVSIVDINTGTIIGTSILDAGGNATIINTLLNGILWLVVKYTGFNNKFKPSQSLISPYLVNFQMSQTSVSSPVDSTYYCPDQNTIIKSFTHLVGNAAVYPVGGLVEFALYTNNTNFISLPAAAVDATGHATSYIPSFTTGLPGNPGDGYYIKASFDGYACFARSVSPAGISGLRLNPKRGEATTTVTSVTPTTVCYSDIITAMVTVTATNLTNPSTGTVTITDMASGNVLGNGTPVNGTASIAFSGSLLPVQIPAAYPHQYTIWANYVPDGYCYTASADHTNTGIGNLLTIKKYFTSLAVPTTANLPDQSHTLAFNFSDVITGGAPNGLDGYFEFKLYKVGAPDILTLRFGGQVVSVPAISNPFTATGIIPGNTMTGTSTYYVVGEYTANGNLCYSTTVVTSGHSVTLTPI